MTKFHIVSRILTPCGKPSASTRSPIEVNLVNFEGRGHHLDATAAKVANPMAQKGIFLDFPLPCRASLGRLEDVFVAQKAKLWAT